MCLLTLAFRIHPQYDLVVAGNRDERHSRPSAALEWWRDAPDVLGGRDLQAGGSWLALQRDGRFAAVTNFRDDPVRENRRNAPGGPSRGELVADFLRGERSAQDYLQQLQRRAGDYAGFNLLLADDAALWYASNRSDQFAQPLAPGVYGLSNDVLDTPWPKLLRSRARLAAWVDAGASAAAPLFALLEDREPAAWGPAEPTAELARVASAAFIVHPEYGTRCSTVVMREHQATGSRITVAERRFAAAGRPAGESSLFFTAARMEPAAVAEL
jgi:uncharacterized protein with NRDE domain